LSATLRASTSSLTAAYNAACKIRILASAVHGYIANAPLARGGAANIKLQSPAIFPRSGDVASHDAVPLRT